MFYRKNLPGWERAMRSVGGVVMIAYGLFGMPGLLGTLRHADGRLFDRGHRRGRDSDRLFRLLPDVRHGRPEASFAMISTGRAQGAAIPR